MNINRYDRKTFRGFVYNLWLYILEFFGGYTRMARRKQKMVDNMIRTNRAFWTQAKANSKGCSGSPRFKGYKE